MSRLFALPAGRRAKWVVVGAWIAILFATFAFDLPAKFADAEQNESASFLPGDAESTRALEITDELNAGEQAPTVVVFARDGGLTPADLEAVEQARERLNEATAAFANTTPFGAPVASEDDSTVLVTNTIEGTGEAADIIDPVDRYRELVSDPGGGLEVKVTGPAGISADAIKVFESIDGTLVAAAVALVFLLLIVIYRSPFFWFFPLLAVGFAELTGRGLGYGLTELGVTVNGQSSAILSILVLGAGTDYALLLVARYREELRRHHDKHEAMARALRSAGPAILASGLTVCAALLSLALAQVNGTAGLGPVGAMGVALAMVVMLTFLPALLVIVGRRPFWPFVPRFGAEGTDEAHGAWRNVGERVARRPRRVAIGATLLLALCSLGLLNFSTGLTQGNAFRGEVESVQGQELVAAAFPGGQAAPTDLVVPPGGDVEAVAAAAAGVEGVAAVAPEPVAQGESGTQLAALLALDPYSVEAFEIVPVLRAAVSAASPGTLVGGPTAVERDLRVAGEADTILLIPIALAIVLLILVVLLRAIVAPILLVLTVVLSFLAALGVGAVVFDVLFGFPGSDASLPLFAFVFLVALGVDYNIFLMARVREEALRHGTRQGMLRGLAVTGGVITSAGIVLAGVFSVLAVLPLIFLTQIGFVIAFGVLLDTFLVRSVLVPALVFDLGPKVWWPSTLAASTDRRTPRRHHAPGATPQRPDAPPPAA